MNAAKILAISFQSIYYVQDRQYLDSTQCRTRYDRHDLCISKFQRSKVLFLRWMTRATEMQTQPKRFSSLRLESWTCWLTAASMFHFLKLWQTCVFLLLLRVCCSFVDGCLSGSCGDVNVFNISVFRNCIVQGSSVARWDLKRSTEVKSRTILTSHFTFSSCVIFKILINNCWNI